MSEDPSWQYEESMKDAPINLPPLPLALSHLNEGEKRWCREWADAAVLADRAGREAYCPNCDCGYGVGVYQPAAPSPAEPKTTLERAYEAVKATKPPAPPNWKEPAEPPAAPVQQEQCVCNEIGLAGVSECLKHPVQQEPDWIECLRRLGRRAERAEAERDALKAELAGQAWTMRDMEDQLAALRAQASPEAVDETMDVSQIAVNVAYKVNATRVHELGGDSLTIFKEPELLAFVREVYAALKHSHD